MSTRKSRTNWHRRNYCATRDDVEMHGHMGRRESPAYNVKDHWNYHPVVAAVMLKHGCTEEVAEKAVEFALESARERFWEDAGEIAAEIWKGWSRVKVYSSGRCGGWLIVEGIGDPREWTAPDLGRWRRFGKRLGEMIDYLGSADCLLEDIDCNEWAQEFAERYNFMTGTHGQTVTIPEIRRAEKAARAAVLAGAPVCALCGGTGRLSDDVQCTRPECAK